MAEKATLWLLRFGIAVPLIYYGIQALAAPFYPDYSVLGNTASELGSDRSKHAVIFNRYDGPGRGKPRRLGSVSFSPQADADNSALAALTAVALAINGVQHI